MIDTLPRHTPSLTHEHGWIALSRHATSEGVVIYARCVDCGAHRVESVATPMPTALTRPTFAQREP